MSYKYPHTFLELSKVKHNFKVEATYYVHLFLLCVACPDWLCPRCWRCWRSALSTRTERPLLRERESRSAVEWGHSGARPRSSLRSPHRSAQRAVSLTRADTALLTGSGGLLSSFSPSRAYRNRVSFYNFINTTNLWSHTYTGKTVKFLDKKERGKNPLSSPKLQQLPHLTFYIEDIVLTQTLTSLLSGHKSIEVFSVLLRLFLHSMIMYWFCLEWKSNKGNNNI